MTIRGVLFDMDGTLVRTEEKLQAALDRLIERELGYLPDIRPSVLGVALSKIGRDMVALDARFGTPDEIVEKIVRENIALIGEGLDVVDGAVETIDEIDGMLPHALVTGSSREEAVAILGRLGVIDKFRFLLCNGEYPGSKPEPVPYLMGAERLGFAPSDCAVLEDSQAGIDSAKAAGCFTVCFLDGLRPDERPGADAYVTDLRKFPQLLRDLGIATIR